MKKLNTPYEIGPVAFNQGKSVSIVDCNGFNVFDCFAIDAEEVIKRINGYEQLEQQLVAQTICAYNLSEFIDGFFEAVERNLPACCDNQRKEMAKFKPSPELVAQFKVDAIRGFIERLTPTIIDGKAEYVHKDEINSVLDQLTNLENKEGN